MPDPNLDRLKALSPSLVAIEWVDTDADRTSQRHCPLCFEVEEAGHGHADDCEWKAIAADLLRLADKVKALEKEIGLRKPVSMNFNPLTATERRKGEMSKEKCSKPAVAIMHWPGKSVPKCEFHLDGWNKVANAIGMPAPSITNPENGELCSDLVDAEAS